MTRPPKSHADVVGNQPEEKPSRLIQVEEQLAITQHLTEQLNDVVTELSQQVTQQGRTIKTLITEIKALKASKDVDASPVDAIEEKPPHY